LRTWILPVKRWFWAQESECQNLSGFGLKAQWTSRSLSRPHSRAVLGPFEAHKVRLRIGYHAKTQADCEESLASSCQEIKTWSRWRGGMAHPRAQTGFMFARTPSSDKGLRQGPRRMLCRRQKRTSVLQRCSSSSSCRQVKQRTHLFGLM